MSSDIDFNERQLCPDDACIGVIGANGRCNECGRVASAPARAPAPESESESDSDSESETETETDSESDSDDRVLCPDESCVGLIGPDGRCKVCGTAAPASS